MTDFRLLVSTRLVPRLDRTEHQTAQDDVDGHENEQAELRREEMRRAPIEFLAKAFPRARVAVRTEGESLARG